MSMSPIVGRVNKQDQGSGRFRNGRIRWHLLLNKGIPFDEAALVAGRAYVHLNPIRAG